MRRLSAPQCNGAPMLTEQSDGELLSRFIATGDEAAFEALVERHKSMVGMVCWSVLGQRQDTEDAVQQTFLVLLRNAASIRKSDSLGSWLHGVALRVAGDIRKMRKRRENGECSCVLTQPAQPIDELAGRELRALLEKEVQHLPENIAFLSFFIAWKARAGWRRPRSLV